METQPERRRSQPRTVGPEPQAARIDSRGDEPTMSAGDSQLSYSEDTMSRKEHWEAVYSKKRPDEVTWYDANATPLLDHERRATLLGLRPQEPQPVPDHQQRCPHVGSDCGP